MKQMNFFYDIRTETGLHIVHNGSRVEVYTKDEWLKKQYKHCWKVYTPKEWQKEQRRVWWANLKNRYFNQ